MRPPPCALSATIAAAAPPVAAGIVAAVSPPVGPLVVDGVAPVSPSFPGIRHANGPLTKCGRKEDMDKCFGGVLWVVPPFRPYFLGRRRRTRRWTFLVEYFLTFSS